MVHHTLAVKGSHLASHNALTESKAWGKVWAVFFIEVSRVWEADPESLVGTVPLSTSTDCGALLEAEG